jgi:CRP-like cAMP-binding protein
MAAGSYFGEMAILSDEPRSATAVVSKPARLLSLRGEPLKELILDMPEISFEIFRVLTARVKAAEGRLHAPAAGSGTAPTGAGPRSGGGSRDLELEENRACDVPWGSSWCCWP